MPFSMHSVAEIQKGLRAKEFSAQEIAKASFARIESFDSKIHAFLETTETHAFKQAARIDALIREGRENELGVLAGVPVAFKDNMNLKGTHTTCASRMLENYISPYTATCVQNLLDTGALPLGKLNMDEFAFGSSTETSAFGRTCNPWNTECVPGGSSGGSAAAVAAGLATITLGSDTGGSIRQPGSLCGVFAVKPTYGMVSRYGVVAFASSLDQVGPFARSVEDVAYAMNALVGRDLRDCTSQHTTTDFITHLYDGIKGMKIGVVPSFMEAEALTSEVKVKLNEAISHLQTLGAEIVEVDLPNALAAISAYYVLGPVEAFSNLSRFDSIRYGYCEPSCETLLDQYEQSRAQGFGPEARRRILLGAYLLSPGVFERYYLQAQQVRTLIMQDYERAFAKVDCIVAPTSPYAAFKFGEITDPVAMHYADMFTISSNIAGNGSMNVPVGLGADSGMPVGVQLQTPSFKDEVMLRVAAALEQVYGPAPVTPAFIGEKGVA